MIIESPKFCNAVSWFIPVGAITIYPFIICNDKSDEVMINHESIHLQQQKEMLFVFFWIFYLGHWVYNLVTFYSSFKKHNADYFMTAYQRIFLEVEAYRNEDDMCYLKTRKVLTPFRKR